MELQVTEAREQQRNYRERKVRGSIFFFPKGEGIWENLENRHNRPHKEYRKLIPAALEKIGYTPEQIAEMKFNWSQYAGCSCPCSPGFTITSGHLGRKDVFVTIELK